MTPRTRWKDTGSGKGGLYCRGARRSGRWVPPARGEREWKPSRGVYTKPRFASPVERRNNSTRPGWKCGNAPWRDPNRSVHKTAGMTRQPLLPLSAQKRLLSSLFPLRRSCGRLHWRHYGAKRRSHPIRITKTPPESKMEYRGCAMTPCR